MRVACIADRVEECSVDVVSLLDQLSDGPQRCSLCLDKFIRVDFVSRMLEGGGSLCSCGRHGAIVG